MAEDGCEPVAEVDVDSSEGWLAGGWLALRGGMNKGPEFGEREGNVRKKENKVDEFHI